MDAVNEELEALLPEQIPHSPQTPCPSRALRLGGMRNRTRPMNVPSRRTRTTTPDRRQFIKTATAAVTAAAAGIAPFAIGAPKGCRALESVNLGVVGTGGRGTGACNDSLTINENVRLVAMGNLRADKAREKRDGLRDAHGEKVSVEDAMSIFEAVSIRLTTSSTCTPTSTSACSDHLAGLPALAPRGGGQGRAARLRREARLPRSRRLARLHAGAGSRRRLRAPRS